MSTYEIKIPCAVCNQVVDITVDEQDYVKYANGANIQDAMPTLDPALREMFLTQICPSCWNALFPEEDE